MAMGLVRQLAEQLRATHRFDALNPAMTTPRRSNCRAARVGRGKTNGARAQCRTGGSFPATSPRSIANSPEAMARSATRSRFRPCAAALRHLMPLLLELRAAKTLPKRTLELAIVTVSQLNACHYCVAHHKPFLASRGVAGGGRPPPRLSEHPELGRGRQLVVQYAIAAWEQPGRIPDSLFVRLPRAFYEAQIVELTLRITLCASFNKFNDALQIEEEPEAIERLSAVGRLSGRRKARRWPMPGVTGHQRAVGSSSALLLQSARNHQQTRRRLSYPDWPYLTT